MNKKWLTALLAVVLVFCAVFSLMGTSARAATQTVDVNGVTISYDDSYWSYSSGTITGSEDSWGKVDTTLTITNGSGETRIVQFVVVSLSNASVTLNNTTYGADSTIVRTVTLAADDVISVRMNPGYVSTGSVSITNFTVTSAETKGTLNLNKVASDESGNVMGSYTVTCGDEQVVISDADASFEFASTESVSLYPTAAEGYQFYRWCVNGTYSSEKSLTVNYSETATEITAEFIPTSYKLIYKVGSDVVYNWEEAMQLAASGSDKIVILLSDYELPAKLSKDSGEITGTYVTESGGNLVYKVPSGVTFLIPYDSSNSTNDLTGDGDYIAYDAGEYVADTQYAYRTMTVPEGATINVDGNFVVNAKREATTGTIIEGGTKGGYGKLILAGTMNVNSGATLVARGYIVDADHTSHTYGSGTGVIHAKDNSTVKVMFTILNHRGGTCSSNVKEKCVPANNYSVANIMVHTEYCYGSTLLADFMVGYSVSSYVNCIVDTMTLITSRNASDGDQYENTLFRTYAAGQYDGKDLADATLVMDYDYATDRLLVVQEQGKAAMENILISIKVGFITVDIDSANSQLPVADCLEIFVGGYPDGTASAEPAMAEVSLSTKLLPSMKIHVLGNGTLNIPESSSLCLYANEDYLSAWSDGKLRTRINIPDVSQPATKVVPSEDAAVVVYENGVVNVSGELQQSASIDSAIEVKGENAQVNFNTDAAVDTTTIAVAETYYTDSSNITVTTDANYYHQGWTGPAGLLSGISTSSADYTAFSTGSYRSVLIDGEYYWYKYKVTYNVQIDDEEGTQEIVKYICDDSYTFNATDEMNTAGVDNPQKYVIVRASEGTAGAEDLNNASDVTAGWENLVLSDIQGDLEVDVTLQSFDYRVGYAVNTDTIQYYTYVKGNSFTKSWDITPLSVETDCFDWTDGAIELSSEVTTDGTSTTTYTAELTQDTKIYFTTDSNVWRVDVKVTDPLGNVTEESILVTKDADLTINFTQPDDCWYILDNEEDVAYEGACDGTENGQISYTIKGVGDMMTVDIQLTRYEHKLSVGLASNVAGDTVTIDPNPYYFNGSSLTLDHGEDLQSTGNLKYIFDPDQTIACTDADVTASKEELNITNASGKTIVFNAAVLNYDSVVTIYQNTTQKIYTDYHTVGDVVKYEFGQYVKINSCQYTNASGNITTYSQYTNPTLDDNNQLTNAYVEFTATSSDVELNVKTDSFDHIITVNEYRDDTLNRSYTYYISGTSYTTYSCPDMYYIKDVSVGGQGSGTATGIGTETLKVTSISGHPTIDVYLQSYEAKVTWYDVDTNTDLRIAYLETIADSNGMDTYTCDTNQVAEVKTYDTTLSFDAWDGDSITVSGIKSGAAQRIGLKLYDYDYLVKIISGQNEKKYYVTDDKNVFTDSSITYTAGAKTYITGYTLSDGAVVTVDGESNVNQDVAKGWTAFKLAGIGSDVTMDLDLETYDYQVTWNVSAAVNGVSTETTELAFVTGDTATYALDSKYTITKVESTGGTTSYEANVASIADLTADTVVNVTAQDFLYQITWIYTMDDENVETIVSYQREDLEDDGSVRWTVPESETGKTYVITGATMTGATGTHTNKNLYVTPSQSNVTVRVTMEEALDTYKALWGKMSFKYYKNGAFYSKVTDGETFEWKLMDTYAWTPETGSMRTTYDGVTYVVPNGSVMIVNPTNQTVTATITVAMDYKAEEWVVAPTMSLVAESGGIAATEDGIASIQVTLAPGETVIVSGSMEGTPTEDTVLADAVAGKWSVTIEPTD